MSRFLPWWHLFTSTLATVTILLAPSAHAQLTVEDQCMEDLAQFGLNCTANDVRIANATDIVILDDGCAFPGDEVTFEATFEVLLTAQARHDIGLYFAVDGDGNGDGAITGTCSVSTMAFAPDPPWLDLDGINDGGFCQNNSSIPCEVDRDCRSVGGACALTQDLCGDIDSDHNPLFPVIQITTTCIDLDGNGKLNLPNCTSWRQPGANELCLDPTDAYPGSPSKCRCDVGFEVDIDVPAATLTVVKTADPTSVDEPQGVVTFSVSVTNDSPFALVTIDTLDDDVYGDIAQAQGLIQSTTCQIPQVLEAGGTYSCDFDALVIGNANETQVDVVTASGTDENGNDVSGSDDASVDVLDVPSSMQLVKTANPTEVLEPGGDVLFTFTVNNTSPVDTLTLDSLTDTIYGDLTTVAGSSCSVPQSIAPGASYSCGFTALVSGNAGYVEMNVATADAVDDDGNPLSRSDSATVNINDVPSSIQLIKTASPETVLEPGADVTFTFTVSNTGTVDTVTIDTLTDSIYGDLTAVLGSTCTVPQVLVPGADYTCGFTAFVAGNAFDSITNVGTASGIDDDGNPVSDDDSATVNVEDVPPAATLTKAATMAVVTYSVTVANDSAAESLSLDALVDDQFGDITNVQGDVLATTCSVPQILAPSGEPGATYECTFDAKVTSSPHVDIVTGTVSDDEGAVVQPSDSATVTFE